MLDQNDLRMIGALLDEKLETKLEEKLEKKLEEKLEKKLAPMKKDIGELKEKMDTYYSSLLTVYSMVEELHTAYKDDIPRVKNDITGLKRRSELYARRFTEMAQAAGSS